MRVASARDGTQFILDEWAEETTAQARALSRRESRVKVLPT